MKKFLICVSLLSFWGITAEAISFKNESEQDAYFKIKAGDALIVGRDVKKGETIDVSSETFLSLTHDRVTDPNAKFTFQVKTVNTQAITCKVAETKEVKDASLIDNSIVTFKMPKGDLGNATCTVEFK